MRTGTKTEAVDPIQNGTFNQAFSFTGANPQPVFTGTASAAMAALGITGFSTESSSGETGAKGKDAKRRKLSEAAQKADVGVQVRKAALGCRVPGRPQIHEESGTPIAPHTHLLAVEARQGNGGAKHALKGDQA